MLGTGIARFFGVHDKIDKVLDLYNDRRARQLSRKIVRERKRAKIFVIGLNKTGTTSVEAALQELGLVTGNQLRAELLLDDIIKGSFSRLVKYCHTAEAFQDIPFSIPGVYKEIDKHFPNSKFILTIRDSPEQWFNSLTSFHGKIWGNGNIPTESQLSKTSYVYKGYPLKALKFIYGKDLYHKGNYQAKYNDHLSDVSDYFSNRPQDLLTLNVARQESYGKMCSFIGMDPVRNEFEWKNKTLKV